MSAATTLRLTHPALRNRAMSVIATLWVCSDCRYFATFGEVAPCALSDEPWATLGIRNVPVPDHDIESGDGVEDCAASECEGCLSLVAGTRFRYVITAPLTFTQMAMANTRVIDAARAA